MNTAFYKYDNIRLKEISIMDAFEQIQENTIAGSAFSARLGSSAVAFIPDPRRSAWLILSTTKCTVPISCAQAGSTIDSSELATKAKRYTGSPATARRSV